MIPTDVIHLAALALHVAAGCVALAAAAAAMAARKGGPLHRRAGGVYVAAMFGVTATTLLLVTIRPNVFLLTIGLFSAYLVFTGWRAGRLRDGAPRTVDRIATIAMLAVAAGMLGLGALRTTAAAGHQGPVLLVFGAIGLTLAAGDLRMRRRAAVADRRRIARHLTRMLAGTIATLTAAAVVNIDFLPALAVWLGPTVLMTPVISWWNVRVLRGPAGTREAARAADAGAAGGEPCAVLTSADPTTGRSRP